MTAAAKKQAATTAKDQIFLIPLNKLVPSPLNVRKTGGQSIEDLAASIQAEGLLQNVTVIEQVDAKGKATGRYEVTAGARRLKAMQQLVKDKALASNHDVPCKIVSADRAISASLAENQMREAMHPADQLEAFKRMTDNGKSIAETAAAFAVSERVVRQRLKLASVHPQLLELYRNDELDLEAITAYASTDDQALQLQVYEQLGRHERTQGYYISEMLTEHHISSTSPLVKFVGLDEYRKAGGVTLEDLFSEQEGKLTLTDSALLNRLVNEKLGKTAAKVKKEGFGWVDIKPSFGYYEKQEFIELPRVQIREATDEQQARLAVIAEELPKARAEYNAIDNEPADEDDDTWEARWQAANDKVDSLEQEDHDIRESLLGILPEQIAIAGAVVTLENGKAKVIRNLLKKSDKKAAETATKQAQEATGITPIAPASIDDDTSTDDDDSGLSNAMQLRLRAQKSIALQAVLATHPSVALATITAQLVHDVLAPAGYYERPAHISTSTPSLNKDDKNIEESKAFQHLAALRIQMESSIPPEALADFGLLIQWLIDQGKPVCTDLLAISLAHFVTARDPRTPNPLETILQLDMRQWWTADRASFFDLVPKGVAVSAVAETTIDEAQADAVKRQFAPLKKAAAAELAEAKLTGLGWLPAPLRTTTAGGSQE